MTPREEHHGPKQRDRKAEHLALALEPGMQVGGGYFDDYVFEHVALPELDLDAIDTGVRFLGKELRSPLLISSMTGGTESAERINRNLAAGAEASGIAFGVGSQRRALEEPSQAAGFGVREVAPTIPILANLGAVQLNYGFGLKECEAAVRMVDADALVLHLNPLQEAIQPEGQGNFRGLLERMQAIAGGLSVPVVAKEIGCGISGAVAGALRDRGIRIIDVAGVGGLSWARIEGRRAGEPDLGEVFADWGISTPEAILQTAAVEGVTVIGSGGIRNGLDVAKAIALGAGLAGLATPFLEAAVLSADAVVATVQRLTRELRIAMFCVGAGTIEELQGVTLRKRTGY